MAIKLYLNVICLFWSKCLGKLDRATRSAEAKCEAPAYKKQHDVETKPQIEHVLLYAMGKPWKLEVHLDTRVVSTPLFRLQRGISADHRTAILNPDKLPQPSD